MRETQASLLWGEADQHSIRELVASASEKLSTRQIAQQSSLGFLAVHCCLESEAMTDVRNQVDPNLSSKDKRELISGLTDRTEAKISTEEIATTLGLMVVEVCIHLEHQDMADVLPKITYAQPKEKLTGAKRRERMRQEIDEHGHDYKVDIAHLRLLLECSDYTIYRDLKNEDMAGYREIMDDKIVEFDKKSVRDYVKRTPGQLSPPEIAQGANIARGRLDRLLSDDDMQDVRDLIEAKNLEYKAKSAKKTPRRSQEHTKDRIRQYVAGLSEQERQKATCQKAAKALDLSASAVRACARQEDMADVYEVLYQSKPGLIKTRRQERIRCEIDEHGHDYKVDITYLALLLECTESTIRLDFRSEELAGYKEIMDEKVAQFNKKIMRRLINENEKITIADFATILKINFAQATKLIEADDMKDARELMETKKLAFNKKVIRDHVRESEDKLNLIGMSKDLEMRTGYISQLLGDDDMQDVRDLIEVKNTRLEKQYIRDHVQQVQGEVTVVSIAKALKIKIFRVRQHIDADDMQETKELMRAKAAQFDKEQIRDYIDQAQVKIFLTKMANDLSMRRDNRLGRLLGDDDMQDVRDLIEQKNIELEKQAIRDWANEAVAGFDLSAVAGELNIAKTKFTRYLQDEDMSKIKEKLELLVSQFEKQQIKDYLAQAESGVELNALVRDLKIKKDRIEHYLQDDDMSEARKTLKMALTQSEKEQVKDNAHLSQEDIVLATPYSEGDDMNPVKPKIVQNSVAIKESRKTNLREFVTQYPHPEDLTPEMVALETGIPTKTIYRYSKQEGMEEVRTILYAPAGTRRTKVKRRDKIRLTINSDWGDQRVSEDSLAQLVGCAKSTIKRDLADPEMADCKELMNKKAFEFNKLLVRKYFEEITDPVPLKTVAYDLGITQPRVKEILAQDDLADVLDRIILTSPSSKKTQTKQNKETQKTRRTARNPENRPTLKLTARQQEMKEYMDKEPYLTLPKIAKRFGLSLNLARRDIRKIGYEGLLD